MFMSCVGLLIFVCIKIFAQSPSTPIRSTLIPKPTDPVKPNQSPSPFEGDDRDCDRGKCRSSPNLVGPIVGAIGGVLALVMIAAIIIWFCLKRKKQKSTVISKTIPEVKFIEYPPLYTGAVSTTDSSSHLYGMSPTRKDSIDSHFYEKIHYNERS